MTSDAPPVVCVVDDDPHVVAMVLRTLESEGYRLVECLDPLNALRVLEKEDVAVLLTDINMPRMSGLELIERAQTLSPNATRIMLSGSGPQEAAVALIDNGTVHRFVHKPFRPAILRAIVAQAVAQWRARG